MSASPMARQVCSSQAQYIPTRKILVTDASQMPDNYSSTPGGTVYSTTPGGTRVIYERAFLMNLKVSPLSQTPPNNIPSCLIRGQPNTPIRKLIPAPSSKSSSTTNKHDDDHLFDMDL